MFTEGLGTVPQELEDAQLSQIIITANRPAMTCFHMSARDWLEPGLGSNGTDPVPIRCMQSAAVDDRGARKDFHMVSWLI